MKSFPLTADPRSRRIHFTAMRARFAGFSFRFQLGGATQARTELDFNPVTAGEQAYAGKH
jgi:hypothetical protein